MSRDVPLHFLDHWVASGTPRERGHYAIGLLQRLTPRDKGLLARPSELQDRVGMADGRTVKEVDEIIEHMRGLT